MRRHGHSRRQAWCSGVRTASRLIAGLALAMLAALGSPFPDVTNAADVGTVAAAELVAAAADGQPVELDGAMIVGDLDLSSIETISRIFRCTRCTFNGSIASSNVIFERLVDLSGADVAGAVDFGGAIFRDAFLMRAVGERPTRVVGPVSFSLATFGSRANFEGAQFGSDVDFRVTQFGGDATFADASIAGDARFDSASFAGRTQFNSSQNATFGGLAAFTTATSSRRRTSGNEPSWRDDFRWCRFRIGRLHVDGLLRKGNVRRRERRWHGRLQGRPVLRRSVLSTGRVAWPNGLPGRGDIRRGGLLGHVGL